MGKKSSRNKRPNQQEYRTAGSAPLIVMAVLLAGLAIWIVAGLAGPSATQEPAPMAEERNGIQVVSMNLSSAGYNPNSFTVRKGIPVQINTDSTADAGCVRGIMIPDFDINEALDVGQDSFTFTPDKTGTFTFTCQMRMSSGTFTVI